MFTFAVGKVGPVVENMIYLNSIATYNTFATCVMAPVSFGIFVNVLFLLLDY